MHLLYIAVANDGAWTTHRHYTPSRDTIRTSKSRAMTDKSGQCMEQQTAYSTGSTFRVHMCRISGLVKC
eukprot:45918-Eustigmatos_ZCMA.PRE.1